MDALNIEVSELLYFAKILLMEEIRRSPVEVGSCLSHYLQVFLHPRGGEFTGFLVAINSMCYMDFLC